MASVSRQSLQAIRPLVAVPARAHAAAGIALQRLLALRADANGASGASGAFDFSPKRSGLPGSGTLQSLTDGIGFWALIASLAGLVVGAATWALGAHSNNYQHTVTGRRAVLVSAAAALLIGFAPRLLTFMFSAGSSAK